MGYQNPFIAHRLLTIVGMFFGVGFMLVWLQWTRPPTCDKVAYEPCRKHDFLDDLLSTEPLPRTK